MGSSSNSPPTALVTDWTDPTPSLVARNRPRVGIRDALGGLVSAPQPPPLSCPSHPPALGRRGIRRHRLRQPPLGIVATGGLPPCLHSAARPRS